MKSFEIRCEDLAIEIALCLKQSGDLRYDGADIGQLFRDIKDALLTSKYRCYPIEALQALETDEANVLIEKVRNL